MKRLVYSPYVQAFIKGDDGVVDVSPYIVRGGVNRKVNQVSSAQLTLRNPVQGTTSDLLFTEFRGKDGTAEAHPMFHPMDPIIIVMQRLQGFPVQVFTGYVDKAPYFQLYPGLCTIEASCTLKRLLYTQWDAALPAVQDFLGQFGWVPSGNGIWNPGAEATRLKATAGHLQGQFNDGSIGALLFAVLNMIGDWDHTTIWIEALPPHIKDIVVNLYKRIVPTVETGLAQFQSLIEQILGANSQGTGQPGVGAGGTGKTWRVKVSSEDAGSGNGWTELSTNGNGAAATGRTQSPTCTSNSVTGCDYATLGKHYPKGTMLAITNIRTGKSGSFPQTDVGNGSGFAPAIGLTPAVQAAIGWQDGDDVKIQLTDGSDLSVASGFGTLLSKDTSTNAKSASNASLAPTDGSGVSPSSSAQQSGRSPGGKTGKTGAGGSALGNIFPYGTKGIFVERTDAGVDFQVPDGVSVGAIADGKIGTPIPSWYKSDWFIQVILDTPINGFPAWYIAEGIKPDAIAFKVGTPVKAGQQIATTQSSGHGIETGWSNGTQQAASGDSVGPQGTDFAHYIGVPVSASQHIPLDWTKLTPGQNTGAGGSGTGTGASSSSTDTMAAAFSTFINLPSIFDMAEAQYFTGKRSFIADQPLFPFIEQLCKASLRNFMSMPNGNFFAFFPDYFGLFGRKYYWEIRDIEIIDGRLDLSDDPLVTNMAVAGDVTQYHATVDAMDLFRTSGIFDIFDAFAMNYIGGTGIPGSIIIPSAPTPGAKKAGSTTGSKAGSSTNAPKFDASQGKASALAFLRKYGARPYVEEVPAIRSPFFELFLSFQNFMLAWSKQFQTTFELTFMPEIFPGGLIALRDHHIQCYVEEVDHNFDYEQGFTTTVSLSSPSALTSSPRKNVSQGLARPTAPIPTTQVGHR